MSSDPVCEVCGATPAFVGASPLGAISHALCSSCLAKGIQPWTTLIGGLVFLGRDDVAEWVKPIIKATCEFYDKSEDELWAEVDKYYREYTDFCKKELMQ